MPISIVVGGQYGSEGKGKVALEMVRRDASITHVVRPGGSNSGHTGYATEGQKHVLRQLPAGVIDKSVKAVIPAGSYIDANILLGEILELELPREQLLIDPKAQVIRQEHIEWEEQARLTESIGSTSSGTGASVLSRIARYAPQLPPAISASEVPALAPYIRDTVAEMSSALQDKSRILIEGTQGFGLSLIHGDSWPKCTSRDTTAAGLLSETGLSPIDVDDIVLVIRCHPIRVSGDSGPLSNETTWHAITQEGGWPDLLQEFTSVTNKLRRVGHFDSQLVKAAIRVNKPTKIVLNHLDYIDFVNRNGPFTAKTKKFIAEVEAGISANVDWVGTSPNTVEKFSREDFCWEGRQSG